VARPPRASDRPAARAFDRVRAHGWGWSGLAAASIGATAGLSFVILHRTPTFVPWLRWVVLAAAIVAVAAIVVVRLRPRFTRRGLVGVGTIGAAVALLGGPTAYAVATVGHGQTGSNPMAGPAVPSGGAGGFGGFG